MIATLQTAGLRGRGGAGFATWQEVAGLPQRPGPAPTITCNADEGEPGTFKDRMLLMQWGRGGLRGPMKIAA